MPRGSSAGGSSHEPPSILAVTCSPSSASPSSPRAADMPIKLIWNASASAPSASTRSLPPTARSARSGRRHAARAARRLHGRARLYRRGVPLLKRVLGLPGQRVCRTGRAITVDGVEMGDALERDRIGRDLPVWQGCRVIARRRTLPHELGVRDSLDGRYFGPIPASSVIGRALPLWTDEDGDGRFVWRAPRTDRFPIGGSGVRRWLSQHHRKGGTMPQIGQFTRDASGFAGQLVTLTSSANSSSCPPNIPMPRTRRTIASIIAHDGPEVGAGGWKRTGERRANISPCCSTIPPCRSRSAPTCSATTMQARHGRCTGAARGPAKSGTEIMRVIIALKASRAGKPSSLHGPAVGGSGFDAGHGAGGRHAATRACRRGTGRIDGHAARSRLATTSPRRRSASAFPSTGFAPCCAPRARATCARFRRRARWD
jgi:type IV secretory pathway protease TraF